MHAERNCFFNQSTIQYGGRQGRRRNRRGISLPPSLLVLILYVHKLFGNNAGEDFFYCFLPGRNEITPRLPKIEKQRRLFEAGDSFRFFLLLLTVGSFVYWIFVRSLFVCIMAGSFVCLSSELYV